MLNKKLVRRCKQQEVGINAAVSASVTCFCDTWPCGGEVGLPSRQVLSAAEPLANRRQQDDDHHHPHHHRCHHLTISEHQIGIISAKERISQPRPAIVQAVVCTWEGWDGVIRGRHAGKTQQAHLGTERRLFRDRQANAPLTYAEACLGS